MIPLRLYIGCIVALAGVAFPLSAQRSGRGFLFESPRGSLVLRGGFGLAAAKGDLFSFTASQLTLGRRDFSGATADLDLAFALARRTDIVFTASYIGSSKGSEFRDFVDQSDNPIQQTTSFQRVPLTLGVRQYLASRGRSVGNFAWIPARFAPYVGAGAGAILYRFRQDGDFIDFNTNDVFSATLVSSGWAPAATAATGLEYTVNPRVALTGQGAYLWSRARPRGDFSGFERIDLSGLSTTVGFLVRF